MDSGRRVYAWVDPGWQPDDPPKTLPAVRLWGDVLLELVAEHQHLDLTPPVAIRRESVFAWLTTTLPPATVSYTEGKAEAILTVDASQCASATIDLAHDVLSPLAWRRALDWLIGRGFDRDLLEEDVVPFAAPTAAMYVIGARTVVESTSPPVLQELLSYFEPAAVQYLASWMCLADSEPRDIVSTEVIVPGSAILAVDR